jgi:hypothetical protein
MALAEDYTFMLGDSGVVLNTSPSNPFVDITRVTGLDSAPFRATERDHEGVDGGFMDAEFEKGRSVILDGTIYTDGTNMETYLDSLKANYAPSRTPVPFYFRSPGVGERVLFAKPLGCRYDWETLRRTGCANAQFSMFAEDPRLYASVLTTQLVNQGGLAFTGRSYNRSYNYTYGAVVTPDEADCVNLGNRDTPVTFTITGSATNPTIINNTEGLTLRVLVNMGASDTLVIDTQYHTVYLNNTNRRDALVDPNWFLLHPGSNFISYLADSVGSSTLQIQFRSAWR